MLWKRSIGNYIELIGNDKLVVETISIFITIKTIIAKRIKVIS